MAKTTKKNKKKGSNWPKKLYIVRDNYDNSGYRCLGKNIEESNAVGDFDGNEIIAIYSFNTTGKMKFVPNMPKSKGKK